MSENSFDVIIIGAGAAGVAAARALNDANFRVCILEARERIGGRIFTIRDSALQLPIELGAEFVHGRPKETWEIIEAAGLAVCEVADEHLRVKDGVIQQPCDFEAVADAPLEKLKEIKDDAPDESFDDFLAREFANESQRAAREAAQSYVEGFHAARAELVGVQGLKRTEAAAEAVHDEDQFRLVAGYYNLLRWLIEEAKNLRIETNRIVREINWRRGHVEIIASHAGAIETYEAARCLITLPLGVLQANADEACAVRFTPAIDCKKAALEKLYAGHAVRVILRFRERFWERADFKTQDGKAFDSSRIGFLHSRDETIPVWWTARHIVAPIITGWVGGSRAEAFAGKSAEEMTDEALKTLARIFQMKDEELRSLLVASYFHDWQSDPFARGAYSYLGVCGADAPRELAAPIGDTLYFAGEATNAEGHHGTVHGAIQTGQRAAREIIKAVKGES